MRKSRTTAPATIYFGTARNALKALQPCVWAECAYSEARAGPIWGHTDAAVRLALAALSNTCDCGRRLHRVRYIEGRRGLTVKK